MDVPSDIYAVGRHACTPTQITDVEMHTPLWIHTPIHHSQPY